MRVLVTGVTGHVGSAVADRLTGAGHAVVGLARGPATASVSADHVEADIASCTDMDRVAAGEACQAVIHSAAAIDASPHGIELARVNCLGTQRVLGLCERWSCSTFLLISSVPVVGHPRALPVTEDHAVNPTSTYLASKVFGEHLTRLASAGGLATCSLRITSPVGPGPGRSGLLGRFARLAAEGRPLEVSGMGTRAQDYVDVRDVADGVLACLEAGSTGLFNLARGEAISNAELASKCVEVLGSTSGIRLGANPDPDDGVRWEVSIERAGQAFGFSPSRSLADSITAVAAPA